MATRLKGNRSHPKLLWADRMKKYLRLLRVENSVETVKDKNGDEWLCDNTPKIFIIHQDEEEEEYEDLDH